MQEAKYLNEVICACTDEAFGQDAIEYAVVCGWVVLNGVNVAADADRVMAKYDDVCEGYRKARGGQEAA